MFRFALIAAAALAGFAAPALAEGRYQLQTVEGGIVRLDTQTGAMDFCKVAQAALDCSPAAPAPRAQAVKPADTVDLDPKAVEKQMDQALKVMDTMLPTMMRAMARMQSSMERELDRDAR